mgnify:CR=1 FL=1
MCVDLPRYPQEFTEDLSRNSHARGEIIIINRKEEKIDTSFRNEGKRT